MWKGMIIIFISFILIASWTILDKMNNCHVEEGDRRTMLVGCEYNYFWKMAVLSTIFLYPLGVYLLIKEHDKLVQKQTSSDCGE